MAGRTFRKAGLDAGGNQAGVTSVEDTAEGTAPPVQRESSNDTGTDTAEFAATGDTQTAGEDGLPIEPTSIGNDDTDQQRRKRTRSDAGIKRGPRGPNKATRVAFSSQGNLEKLLLSLHTMGAVFLKTPELRIDAEESAILSKATLDVMKAYGVPELTDKQLAASQALMAIGTVYGPRFILIMNRKNQKPKLVPPVIPFPAAQAVQQSQPPIPQPAVQQNPPNTYGAAPVQPPNQPRVNMGVDTGFISSQVFAAETGAGIETVNPS